MVRICVWVVIFYEIVGNSNIGFFVVSVDGVGCLGNVDKKGVVDGCLDNRVMGGVVDGISFFMLIGVDEGEGVVEENI